VQSGNDITPESLVLVWLATRSGKPETSPGLLASQIARPLKDVVGSASNGAGLALGYHLASLAKQRLVQSLPPADERALPRWRVTPAGRERALQVLGVSAWPSRRRVDWSWAKRVLVLRALGQLPASALQNCGKAPWLAAWFLARHHDLPRWSEATPTSVLAQLAARAAGASHPDRFNLSAAFSSLVARSNRGTPAPFELELFARRVNEAARAAPTGRWMEDRVFIAHVWKEMDRRGHYPGLSLSDFQGHLVQAHEARMLRLVRGDLVAALPRDDVRASETQDGDATFHFVSVGRAEREGARQ
jgi:hypothetical protein